ncbi:MAG: glycosyltransferase family 4 protein [Calditrichaeota bacterium]|nr:glycosyltransferase family 4 protein [Calditrichota bacterium]MCB9366282.1 glycosyltransferase family 4 protein [Calditrichota bacterium]
MRVLLTCHVRFASALAWYAHSLTRGLQAAGHDVFMYAQRNSPLAEWARQDSVPHNDDFDFHSTNPLQLSRAVRSLKRKISEFRPDVLNPHCPPGHALLALLNRSHQLPLIRTVAEPRPPKRNLLNRMLHERSLHGLIYSSASSVERYRDVFDLRNVRQSVILPGLDLGRFPPMEQTGWRAKLGVRDDQLLAAIIARMSPEKGQELLIRALALLVPAARDQLVVVLTGDDSRERRGEDLKVMAHEHNVTDSLRFLPRLSDVRTLINELDLGIITSVRSEAVCRIALEYMAYGKPIVSTNINILPEVIRHEQNGWIVDPDDPRSLADILLSLLGDRQKLDDSGRRATQLLHSDFTLEKVVEQTIDFYNAVSSAHA